jgi:hypothetical protein
MRGLLAAALILLLPGAACGQAAKPEDTETYSPVPPVVTPGAKPGAPPSDAIVLFDGKDLSQWVSVRDKGPAGWTIEDGAMIVKLVAGNIETRQAFGDYQLHIEWRVPAGVTGKGQLRGNSGLFLASTGQGDAGYELQILDSYRNETYVNGQAASIYKQAPPLANAMRPPGEWQTYDVVWTAPRFGPDGALKSPARVTAFQNGVLVQNDFALEGPTRYIGKPAYSPHGRSPIKLQAHAGGGPVAFRNIWVRPLDGGR